MYFDALSAACIADELIERLLGGRVQQVVQPDDLSVGLEVYAERERHYLILSAHAQFGRVGLVSYKLRRGVDKETGLLVLLRKYVRGARLCEVHQPPWERLVRFAFEHPEWGRTDLYAEVMGRHANVILVGPPRRILDAVKHIGPHLSRRVVLPGRPYTPPPPQEKLPPDDLTEYRLQQILEAQAPDAQVWRALVANLCGTSPLLAREVVYRALGQPRARVEQVSRLSSLLEALGVLLEPVAEGGWQPSMVRDAEGQVAVFAPYPVTHRGEPEPVPSLSAAMEAYVADQASADPYAAAKRRLHEAIQRARGRLERRREAIQEDTPDPQQADQWRAWGEWLLAFAHQVERGAEQFVAEPGDGSTLTIPLDPQLSAVENAQAYFARYRKAQRAADEAPARLREVQVALDHLDQLATDLNLAANRPEIEEVRVALQDAGHLRARQGARARTPAPRARPLRVESSAGWLIWVGRSSRQNDELTFKRARSDDWWLHARGVPGAHVIVRGEGQARAGEELPPATLQRAAELAAYYSQARDEASVPVDVTRRRYVRRISGAAPGLVTYTHEQTLRVAPRGA
jgi:predicted ribosome quality control (RQC) complex YloA/Tae2 family protein